MRVLFLSRIYWFDGSSSLANVPRLVVHRMLRDNPDLHVTWVIPKGSDDQAAYEFLVTPLPEEVQPQIRLVQATKRGFERMSGYWLTDEVWDLFAQSRVDLPYDVIMVQQAALVPIYRAMLSARARASQFTTTTPVLHWGLWTATLSQLREVPEYYMGESDIVSEVTGCWQADLNVFESEYLRQDVLRTAREWLLPAAVRKLEAKTASVHVGVNMDVLDDVYEQRTQAMSHGDENLRSPGLHWGSRFAGQKKPRITLPLMVKVENIVAASGRDLKVSVSSSQPIPEWAQQLNPDWRMEGNLNTADFYRRIATADVFLCNSVSEGYGTAWLEMLGAGMLGVFQRSWWNERLLPDWYPFVTDSKEEQVQIAAQLLMDWPDGEAWQELVPKVRAWMNLYHSDHASGPAMMTHLRRLHEGGVIADASIGRGSIGQLAVKAAEAAVRETGSPRLPEDVVWARMAELSTNNSDWGTKGALITRSYLRRALQANGWEDVGLDAVVFEKS